MITVKAKHGLISSLAKSNLYPTYKRTPEKKSVSLKKQAVEFPACLGFFFPLKFSFTQLSGLDQESKQAFLVLKGQKGSCEKNLKIAKPQNSMAKISV